VNWNSSSLRQNHHGTKTSTSDTLTLHRHSHPLAIQHPSQRLPHLTPFQTPHSRRSACLLPFHPTPDSDRPTRGEDYVPNLWEIPGRSCDADESILAGTVRELWGESGLVATEVLRQVGETCEWVEEGKVWCKFRFEVEVEGMEVRLDEEEH
jgi:8-oxo-dGTP pyrophosphatase MutT (NUDIX family)